MTKYDGWIMEMTRDGLTERNEPTKNWLHHALLIALNEYESVPEEDKEIIAPLVLELRSLTQEAYEHVGLPDYNLAGAYVEWKHGS